MSSSSRRVCLLIAAVALAGSLAPAAPESQDPNVALAREQLKLTDLAFKDMDSMMSNGELNLSDPKFSLWGKRKLDALRAARVGKDEMIVALTDYLNRTKQNESHVIKAHQAGQASRIDVHDAQYRRVEAEM